MAIYVTGDTHGCSGAIRRFSYKGWEGARDTSLNDIMVILGDFGAVWAVGEETSEERYTLNWLNNRGMTFAFVDGNHENHTRLNEYPEDERWGGKVHVLRENVIHLMRGEHFDLPCAGGTVSVFAFGGAKSQDQMWRTPDVTWWANEQASMEEMQHGLDVADAVKSVDFVLTHEAPFAVVKKINEYYLPDSTSKYLDIVEERLEYKHWYFGHHHIDEDIDDKHTCLYNDILKIAN